MLDMNSPFVFLFVLLTLCFRSQATVQCFLVSSRPPIAHYHSALHTTPEDFLSKKTSALRHVLLVTTANPKNIINMTTKASGESSSSSTRIQGSVFLALTVDGFIATADGGVEFLDNFHDPDPNATPSPPTADDDNDELGFAAYMRSVDCLVMGRKTFEKVLSFGRDIWGYGETPVIVWSRKENYKTTTDMIPDHLQKTVSCSSLPPAQLFAELNTKKGFKRVYIDGGSTVRQFLAADLIDEMILTRVPILLGDGIPLFDKNDSTTALQKRMITMKHIVTKAYPSGLVTTKYHITRDTRTDEQIS